MSVDRWLQGQVLAALEHEPGVEAAHVGVSVLDGVVTLHGIVPTFRQKWLAERAARLASRRCVANALEVASRGGDHECSDTCLARCSCSGGAGPRRRREREVRVLHVTSASFDRRTARQQQRAAVSNGVRGVVCGDRRYGSPGGHVQQDDEDPEEEQRGAEIPFEHQHGDADQPDRDDRAEHPAGRQP